eukprot:SAG31_NODE_38409_length_296_cov_1.020305_1_plen_44_part_00
MYMLFHNLPDAASLYEAHLEELLLRLYASGAEGVETAPPEVRM